MKRRLISWMLAAVMVMTSAAVWMGNEKQAEAAAAFKVHFIEVGTGDGALLQYGSGKSAKYALIDAGPQTTQLLGGKTIDVSRRVHHYLKKYKIRRLEFIIMTHPHKDHIGGFISILEDRSISVGKVYATQQPVYNHYSGDDDFYSTKTYRTVNELIAERGIPVVVPRMKSSVYLGKAKLTFYSPGRTNFKYGREVDFNSRQVNKFSLVCRITYGKNSFLMTGDTQQESEYDMISQRLKLKSQVLKVPHHGYEDVRNKDAKGKFSSNHKKFFDKVQPAISIISNGYRNKDRVPSGLITRELAKSNIYTTGDNGNIIVTSNGSRLSVSTSRNKNEPAKASTYVSSKKSSLLLKKMSVKSNGKKKLSIVSVNAKNKYKIKEKKPLKISIKATPQSFTRIKNVQYKLVKKGKSSAKYRWKTGKKVKVKKGFKGRLYIKYNTTSGSTIVKTKGFVIKKKKK